MADTPAEKAGRRRGSIKPLAGSAEEKALEEEQKNAWKKDFDCYEGPLVKVMKMGIQSLKENEKNSADPQP